MFAFAIRRNEHGIEFLLDVCPHVFFLLAYNNTIALVFLVAGVCVVFMVMLRAFIVQEISFELHIHLCVTQLHFSMYDILKGIYQLTLEEPKKIQQVVTIVISQMKENQPERLKSDM